MTAPTSPEAKPYTHIATPRQLPSDFLCLCVSSPRRGRAMANDSSPSGRPGRRCGTPTRVDLLTILLAAALCSASYYLGIWHNSRGAADSRVLAPSAAVAVVAAASCAGDSDEPLDFETHHAAEGAGLSVSSSSSTRRALLGAAPGRMGLRGAAWVARVGVGGGRRFMDAGAVRA
ncbi:hypothetical protein HU200_035187 [Digitaria exilis]|uniref:Uncharacterized protein n=1 Tax=Digitaria exilis TaxID=1010633 RepID=A0A835EN70_9POAL|nr:hypothetical protein HU200_035187 [Digitaria exilis]